MIKRLAVLILCLGLVSPCAEAARKGTPKKPATQKVQKVKPAPAQHAVEPTEQNSSEQVDELKEDVGSAIANLKAQIEKVAKDDKEPKVSGVFFFQFEKGQQNITKVSNFDLTRAYITYKDKLNNNVGLRITLDAGRLDTSGTAGTAGAGTDPNKKSQSLYNFVKYAYADIPIPLPQEIKIVPMEISARLGLQQTPWIDYVDGFWGNRYIAKVLWDNEGIISSADFGVGALGKISLPGLPEVEYHGTLLNGAGYKSAETNSAKNVGLRVNSTIYQDDNIGAVSVGAFGQMTNALSTATATRQLGAMVALKNSTHGTAYAEYLYGTGISGYSVAGQFNVVPELALIGRIDRYDPDRSDTTKGIDRTILGAAYAVGTNVKLALDVQNKTAAAKTESTLFAHSMVSF